MAGQRSLEPSVVVRVHVPQPAPERKNPRVLYPRVVLFTGILRDVESSLSPWLGEQGFHVHHPALALVLEYMPVNREGKVGG